MPAAKIPSDVLLQIKAIWHTGIADPTDSYMMTRVAYEMDLAAAFFWIDEHREEYERWACDTKDGPARFLRS